MACDKPLPSEFISGRSFTCWSEFISGRSFTCWSGPFGVYQGLVAGGNVY